MSTPSWTVRGSAYSRCGSDAEYGRPVIAMTSSARTTRRPFSGRIRAAASGSAAAQPRVQRRRADALQLGLEPATGRPRRCRGTRSGRGSRGCRAPSRRPAPAPARARAARRSTARAQPWNCATVAVSVTVLGVQQVVHDAAPLGDRQLGRADVHAAVDLHGVGVDDLAAQPLREVEGQPGLAGGGGPDDGHERDRARGPVAVRGHAVSVSRHERRRQTWTHPGPPAARSASDAPGGGSTPDADAGHGRRRSRARTSTASSKRDDSHDIPPVTHDERDQGDADEAVQLENAETSLDQPSS